MLKACIIIGHYIVHRLLKVVVALLQVRGDQLASSGRKLQGGLGRQSECAAPGQCHRLRNDLTQSASLLVMKYSLRVSSTTQSGGETLTWLSQGILFSIVNLRIMAIISSF